MFSSHGASILSRLVEQYHNAQYNSARCSAIQQLLPEHAFYIESFRKMLIGLDDYEQLATLDEMVLSYRKPTCKRIHMSQGELFRHLRERK